MKKIILSTESGADLPQDIVVKHNIKVVPMHIIMDDIDYLDDSIPITDIYDYYDRTKNIPSTTSTNPNEYHNLFTEIRTEFPDSIILHVGYTSKASSSFHHACMAAENFEDIHLIDALNVSGGLTAIIMHAAKLLEREPTIELNRLMEEIKSVIPKARFSFTPGRLDFLKAGGRVSNVAYFSGILLKIKPRIELIEGQLVSTKKYRGKMRDAAKKLFFDYIADYNIDRGQLFFLYSLGLKDSIMQQMDELAKEHGFENVRWMEAGTMISTHAGPGGFGVAGLEI